MNAGIYLDDDIRNNVLRSIKDNKQFNIYPTNDFAVKLVEEVIKCYKKQ
jgi:hypothetical protein